MQLSIIIPHVTLDHYVKRFMQIMDFLAFFQPDDLHWIQD